MPCAFEMLIAVWCAASIWLRLSALRHAEAAKLRAAVLNIVALWLKEANNVAERESSTSRIHDDAISADRPIKALSADVATARTPLLVGPLLPRVAVAAGVRKQQHGTV